MKERKTIEIIVNGDHYRIAENSNVSDLIDELKLIPQRLAIELNLSILPRAAWPETTLCEGDKLEIIHFVGGG